VVITRREKLPEGEDPRPGLPASVAGETPPPAPPERPLSVAELVARVRDHLHAAFRFPVTVQGEASNVRRPRAGNLYFTLKDRRAQIRVVVFAANVEQLPAPVEEGAQLVVRGQVTAYLDAGDLQLVADRVEPVGWGERALRLERLKARLRAEGLFDPARKRPLPFLPRTIGLVTSPTGAAIRDVITTIERRCPSVRIVVSPVRVSGEAAAPEIALALAALDRSVACDVIVVARGGGSREELQAFDDERVVRAIVSTRAPVVAGIGHETDVSLADFAADVRAPTPTAAAELIVPELAALEADLHERARRLAIALRGRVDLARRRLEACARSFGFRAPTESVARHRSRLLELEVRLEKAALAGLERRRLALGTAAASLDSLSPLKVLARGFSLTVRAATSEIVRDSSGLAPGDELETRLARGTVRSRVLSTEPEPASGSERGGRWGEP
jgi:exodeoxyribonuclease VII large subunit